LSIAIALPLAAAALTVLIIAWMLKARAGLPLDIPSDRSLHNRAVPRSGGLAMMVGTFAGFAVIRAPLVIVLTAAALVIVSHLDDIRSLPVAARLVVHLLAAVVYVAVSLPALPLPLCIVAVAGIVWMTNLYNFMDGSDGLAAGMTVVGFASLGIGASMAGDQSIMLASYLVAAAAAGFLVFNFPPARIFMGDAGSIPLGYLAATLSMEGWSREIWPIWFPVLVFSPFIVDASLTLAKRALRGERFWIAHKSHYYQRLVQIGWGHRRTAIAEFVLMLACGTAGLAGIGQPLYWQLSGAAVLATIYLALALWIDRAWRRHLENRS
jgi:UDP-N-acetylmuramyl pentapeptide phosphotransferase/UDP-N-acetylglucosamine-1-phosphate transferase